MAGKVAKLVPKADKKSPIRSARADRWINPTNEFGGENDPISRTYFGADYRLSQTTLDRMYEGDWVARRVVEIPAKDATREGITLSHDKDPKKAEIMTEELQRLDVMTKIEEAIVLSRNYGGCAMILGAFDGKEPSEELGTVQRVDWLANVDRFHAFPMSHYQDPLDARFGTPELYTIQRLSVVGANTMDVHESRIIRFDGVYLPPRLRIRNFGWGAPVYQHLHDALRQFGVSVQSGASVLQDFITLAVKVGNLQELIRDDKGEEELLQRLSIMAAERAMQNIAVYGEDEEVEKMGTPVSGLPELIEIFMDIVSAAAEIPKSRFFHNQTGRLGGDAGANDLRTHYDNIASFQKTKLNDPIQRIIDIIAEPHGIAPGEIKFEWNSLWQLSEAELADTRLKVAQADEIYMRNAALDPEEVAINRFGGEGVNITDMTIDVERRQKYLDELSKQPVDLDEPEDPDGPGEEGDSDDNPDPDEEGDE